MNGSGKNNRSLENRPLKGETTGFLTEKRRKFLKTPVEERKDAFGEGNTNQYNMRIKERAKQAVRDLALVAYGMPEKEVREIFDVEDMDLLLRWVVLKIGRDKTPRAVYFRALLQAIEGALNYTADEHLERVNIEVSLRPYLSETLIGQVVPPDFIPE
ncbi:MULTISPECIES: hypothetical protein [unclassified Methanoculleus]|jgi:hypothetical protein|uniref:hypothetical protein n=1 Tax=unclassified Methanoculleus TaxID=2619537 RepID=UPI00319E2EF3